jgi:6-phosphogluconolactonase
MVAGICAHLEKQLRLRIARSGCASMALPGGKTPIPIYRAMSRAPLDWRRVHVTLTDERWSDPRSLASNERMIRANLLKRRASRARFTPLKTPSRTPSRAVMALEKRLAVLCPFDICVLGMGADGHIASLFPEAIGLDTAIRRSRRRVAALFAPQGEGSPERLSLTLSEICRSREIVLILTGNDKLRVLENIDTITPRPLALQRLLARHRPIVHAFWAP